MLDEKDIKFLNEHSASEADDLLLHSSRYPDIDIRGVVVQLKGRNSAMLKLPLWASTEGILYPEHISIEQCSSERSARYKSDLVRRLVFADKNSQNVVFAKSTEQAITVTDLTGGFGVDAVMLALGFDRCRLTFVERNADLCELAGHNFPLLGVRNYEIVCCECEELLPSLPHQDIIFIDPARRDIYGHKTVALSDCSPDVSRLNSVLLEKAGLVVVKMSPMLDMWHAIGQLSGLGQVHIVSVDGECKELLAVMSNKWKISDENDIVVFCVNIVKDQMSVMKFRLEELRSAIPSFAKSVHHYLYEPNASVMKCNAANALSVRCDMEKLHPNSQLLTSDKLIESFPGRVFEVVSTYGFSKSDLKVLTSSVKKANLTVRNFPLSVGDLRKRLKIKEGGDDYLFATTLCDNSRVIILCRKIKL